MVVQALFLSPLQDLPHSFSGLSIFLCLWHTLYICLWHSLWHSFTHSLSLHQWINIFYQSSHWNVIAAFCTSLLATSHTKKEKRSAWFTNNQSSFDPLDKKKMSGRTVAMSGRGDGRGWVGWGCWSGTLPKKPLKHSMCESLYSAAFAQRKHFASTLD